MCVRKNIGKVCGIKSIYLIAIKFPGNFITIVLSEENVSALDLSV